MLPFGGKKVLQFHGLKERNENYNFLLRHSNVPYAMIYVHFVLQSNLKRSCEAEHEWHKTLWNEKLWRENCTYVFK